MRSSTRMMRAAGKLASTSGASRLKSSSTLSVRKRWSCISASLVKSTDQQALAAVCASRRTGDQLGRRRLPLRRRFIRNCEALGKSIPRTAFGQVRKGRHHRGVIAWRRPASKHASDHAHRLARPPDGKTMPFMNERHDLTVLDRPQSFFSITSFKARFSRLGSAYICLSRAFSCSGSRMRLISELPYRRTCSSIRGTWRC